ncbi:hemicentin-1-like isoform X6 [Haliotis rufescens]|uniref:hemicentin-1-like isoform X6 n=1 Tax=Haliotis rufescens TaxID=6454 RepID=UPI00201E9CE5|nr:hemicentin-1-like isoform X6 [Haliotis rufescens]
MTSQTNVPSKLLCLALVLSVCSLCTAQIFTKPFLSMQTPMNAGTSYTLSCSSIANGAQITYVWRRGDQLSPFSTSTTCTTISTSAQGIVSYECVSAYQLTVRREDNGVNITCIATSVSGRTNSDTGTFYIQTPPLSQYPEIIGNDTINEGQNVTYLCVADGAVPQATLRWRVGSTSIVTDGYSPPATVNTDGTYRTVNYLYRTFSASDDGIQIRCDMSHPASSGKRATKTVTVQYKPTITSSPTSYTLTEGVTGFLHCSFAAKPTPTIIRWLKDNQVLDRSSGRFLNGDAPAAPSLTINNPQSQDAGTYVCTASNVVGKGSGPDVTVVVKYKPKVSIPNATYGADISESLTIPCNIDADPSVTSVTWYRNSTGSALPITIPSGSKYTGGTLASPSLLIFNLQPSDAASYQCEAGNILGTTRSNAVTVSISYAPTNIRTVPNSFEVNAGGDVLVTCFADAVPSPTYAWFFQTDSINPVSNSAVLNITSSKPSDDGRYTCKATNEKGEASIIVGISVRYPPIISSSATPQEVDEGSSVTLLCSVTANPIPFGVVWYKNSQFLDRTNLAYSGGDSVASPHLTISNIQKSDAGIYHCEVPNQMGRGISENVTVRVVYPPESIAITPPDDTHTLNEGDSLTLVCVVNAVPLPTYQWRAGSQVIASLPLLAINPAGPEDNRDVTCVGSNTKGNITKTVRVNVEYRPRGILKNPVIKTTIGNSATLTCQTKANPATSSYTWSFGSKQLAETGASLEITPTTVDDFGLYTCVATNTIGSSDPINLTLEEGTTAEPPKTGASTASLGTEIIVLIVLLFLILIIIIIVIIIVCYKKGKCGKKKEPKGRVAPVIEPKTEPMPTAVETSSTDAEKPSVRTRPQWSAVSRQDVHVNVNNHINKEHNKMSVEDETSANGTIPNGAPAGGPIISIKDPDDTPRAHHLPPLHYGGGGNGEEDAEERRKRRRKKRRKRQDEGETTEQPKSDTIDEEEE